MYAFHLIVSTTLKTIIIVNLSFYCSENIIMNILLSFMLSVSNPPLPLHISIRSQ